MGRDAELATLHELLQQNQRIAITAITGMGGVGKTELAIQYAATYQEHYPSGICWIRGRDEDIAQQIVEFAEIYLDLKPPKTNEQENVKEKKKAVKWCWQHWHQGNALVILDDVNYYEVIKPYLPPQNSKFWVLITTRLQLLTSVQRLELEVLKSKAAINLLESLINKIFLPEELNIAHELCQKLGYLPLGLELVGRYLSHKPDLSLAEVLQQLREQGLTQKALKKHKWALDITAQEGVAAAFELSWKELSSDAQELSYILCIFDLVPISWHIVEQCFPERNRQKLKDIRDDFLLDFHLLQHEGNQTYRLHELVREFFQSKLVESTQTNLIEAVTLTVGKIVKRSPTCANKLFQKGLLNWSFPPNLHLSALEWGKLVWIASQSWYEGLGKLAPLVMPIRKNGDLPVLGIAITHKEPNSGSIAFEPIQNDDPNSLNIITGWYFGHDIKESVIELPQNILNSLENNYNDYTDDYSNDWNYFLQMYPIKQNFHAPWQYTSSAFLENLPELLKERRLSQISGYLSLEPAWYIAIYLTNRKIAEYYQYYLHYTTPIYLDEIENKLAQINMFQFSVMKQHCLNQLKTEVSNLRRKGQNHLKLPAAVENFRKTNYPSSQVLLEYIIDIYKNAIYDYENLVNDLFSPLLPQLQLASILPARLVGTVVLPKHRSDAIHFSWTWVPLPSDRQSYVDFKLGDTPLDIQDSRFNGIIQNSKLNLIYRMYPVYPRIGSFDQTPFTKGWLGTFPVTNLVYQWLWNDLKVINWVRDERLDDMGYPCWR
ncbi:NB-ARC domain-containing protein [Spirulina sp. CS-785/01]|uniref:NB-ARC domain-containing protein n=1 Tax=Spirulina sp. CS-785/01 TaxID=3021716 RepID=UPI00232F4730|nr:NB-ARC domain-containing protein [Spirulina sp. CS-785/01]MDB9312086.1 NB-ARC domain-containing protein [Spirulina sp. CS-785/01]